MSLPANEWTPVTTAVLAGLKFGETYWVVEEGATRPHVAVYINQFHGAFAMRQGRGLLPAAKATHVMRIDIPEMPR